MKTIYSLVATLLLAGTCFAGTSAKEFKQPVAASCFEAQELQLDLFGSYSWITDGKHEDGDGFGGGLGVNYFFTRILGVGVDGNILDGDASGLWNVTGKLIARFPIDSICLAPYLFVGGGVQTNGDTIGIGTAGAGVEYRVVPNKFGIFTEGRYTLGADNNDAAQARFGFRFVF